jgi:hypothetical protein
MKGPYTGPFFMSGAFVVEAGSISYIPPMVFKAQRIILVDHARLPWRFFGRLTAVQAGL